MQLHPDPESDELDVAPRLGSYRSRTGVKLAMALVRSRAMETDKSLLGAPRGLLTGRC